MTSFIIRATCSSIFSGTNSAPCKDRDGRVMYFDSREEAEQKAAEYRASMGRSEYSTASFRYEVERA